MWGFPLQFWQSAVVWLWVISAVATGVAVGGSLLSAIVSHYIGEETKRLAAEGLERWKVEAEAQIQEANARAESAHAEMANALSAAALADQKAAQANAAVANANLEIARIKTPRILTRKALDRIADTARRYPGACFVAAVKPGDSEALHLLEQLEEVLTGAGWKQEDWSDPAATVEREGKPKLGQYFGVGASVGYHGGTEVKWMHAAGAVSREMGVPASVTLAMPETVIGARTDCLRLIVGAKPV